MRRESLRVMMRGTIDMKILLFRHVIIIPGARLIWKGFYDPLYLRYTFGELCGMSSVFTKKEIN